MSRANDKYVDMEIALTDEWLKQGKLSELTFADAIEYGYNQASKDYIEYAQLWVNSGEVNIKSFKQFLKDRGYE